MRPLDVVQLPCNIPIELNASVIGGGSIPSVAVLFQRLVHE
jgi:hypothetical protein